MGKLHELLAVEKTTNEQAAKMMQDAEDKFRKSSQYFEGSDKRLEMLVESDAKAAIEAAGGERKELITSVHETLEYALEYLGKSEDVRYQINESNRHAVADVEVNGVVLLEKMPINQLVGLESRLTRLRATFAAVPTLNAALKWEPADSGLKGAVRTVDDLVTTKTEKKLVAVTIAPATDKHPAQVEKTYPEEVVGKYITTKFSGAATSQQKADLLDNIDALIAGVKQARTRANNVDATNRKISSALIPFLLSAFNK